MRIVADEELARLFWRGSLRAPRGRRSVHDDGLVASNAKLGGWQGGQSKQEADLRSLLIHGLLAVEWSD